MSEETAPEQQLPSKRKKACYIGAPAHFKLEIACKTINDAFGDYGCYIVGSCTERPDWRDVDIRFIMKDENFFALFPAVDYTPSHDVAVWEFDPRWTLMTVSIAAWLQEQTGLPIDFQIQPMSHANGSFHKGKMRQPIGLRFAKRGTSDDAE